MHRTSFCSVACKQILRTLPTSSFTWYRQGVVFLSCGSMLSNGQYLLNQLVQTAISVTTRYTDCVRPIRVPRLASQKLISIGIFIYSFYTKLGRISAASTSINFHLCFPSGCYLLMVLSEFQDCHAKNPLAGLVILHVWTDLFPSVRIWRLRSYLLFINPLGP